MITEPFAWRFVGEGVRTAVFIQTFTLLAVIAWRRPTWTAPEALVQPFRSRTREAS